MPEEEKQEQGADQAKEDAAPQQPGAEGPADAGGGVIGFVIAAIVLIVIAAVAMQMKKETDKAKDDAEEGAEKAEAMAVRQTFAPESPCERVQTLMGEITTQLAAEEPDLTKVTAFAAEGKAEELKGLFEEICTGMKASGAKAEAYTCVISVPGAEEPVVTEEGAEPPEGPVVETVLAKLKAEGKPVFDITFEVEGKRISSVKVAEGTPDPEPEPEPEKEDEKEGEKGDAKEGTEGEKDTEKKEDE